MRPHDRTTPIDESRRVPLSAPALLSGALDQGPVAPAYPLDDMVLFLRSDPGQQSVLAQLGAAQQDSRSALYHHWLTPETFGAHFGVSPHDLAAVIDWLRDYGFAIEPPPASRRWLIFSGTASQVEAAFHIEIHAYAINGRTHHANATTPDIPEALADVVEGLLSLNDFRASPGHHRISPKYLSGSSYLIAPYDFAAIYDSIPLLTNGSSLEGGQGVNIAIVARSNIDLSDVTDLQANSNNYGIATPQILTPYGNPGVDCNQSHPNYSLTGCGDWLEATLDVTRAGSVAPQAGVILVAAASTDSTDGLILSAQYIVDKNLAQVVSLSYSECEPAMSQSVSSFWSGLWTQAVSQGMSVFVASGDWGADACYPQRQEGSTSFKGRAVNGLCSPPSAICVGGTELDDASSPGSYWSSAGNALGYIPENVWNDIEGSVTFASGGGASTLYSKPVWQQAVTPADGARDVPDVAVSASFHDSYLIYVGGQQTSIEGTSAAAPSFAGIMALMIASTGSDLPWGNPGPTLYELQQVAMQNPFHASMSGNNSLPGVTGYSVTEGPYNQATGFGSVDAALLAGAWPGIPLSISVTHSGNFSEGQNGATYTVTVSTATRPSAAGTITVTDSLPAGLTMVSMKGTGWTCSTTGSSGACTNNISLSVNSSYPITVTVNVGSGVTSPATNTVTLAGGGSLALTAQDVTTILLLTQSISFAPLTSQVLGEQPFTLSASASSGLAVTLTSTAPGVCQLSGSTVSLVGLGTCDIQASQLGNGTYAAAKSVSQSFLVVSACDLTMSGGTSLSDVQQIVNEALGVAAPANNLSASGTVNVLDIQIEIDAALRLGCAAK